MRHEHSATVTAAQTVAPVYAAEGGDALSPRAAAADKEAIAARIFAATVPRQT